MKKNTLLLSIILVILLLVGGVQIGKALATPDSEPLIAASYPRVEVPDYPADGKFFNEMYQKSSLSVIHQESLDYQLDAEFFNDWYRQAPLSSQSQWIPDYPLDGKVFVDHFIVLP